MAMLGKHFKTEAERKRYSVFYTDWLDEGETVSSVVFTIDPPDELEVDASSISAEGDEVIFFVNAGEDGTEYTVNVAATTSGGQVKEDQVVYEVAEP
jgi:hypothetical protein